jgi:hypothetical protein
MFVFLFGGGRRASCIPYILYDRFPFDMVTERRAVGDKPAQVLKLRNKANSERGLRTESQFHWSVPTLSMRVCVPNVHPHPRPFSLQRSQAC